MNARVARGLVLAILLAFGSCSLTVDEEALRSTSGRDGGNEPVCDDDEKLCNVDGIERCVGVDVPGFGCARANCIPCSIPHATTRCNLETGECERASCQRNWDDCDDDESNGCETHTDTDVNHCGRCNDPCEELANAEVRCGGSECYIRVCDAGWKDCNETVGDGCETPCEGECTDDTCE